MVMAQIASGISSTGKTIYYSNLLHQLNKKVKKRLRRKESFFIRTMQLLTNVTTRAKISELKYEQLDHPSHSPDLAPSDFWVFMSGRGSHWKAIFV